MTKIICVNENHAIEIADESIHRNDEYISFEFPNFNWLNHAMSCEGCKAFFDSFGKDFSPWLLFLDNEYYLLDTKNFGNHDSHFENLVYYETSSKFEGTRVKFRKIKKNIEDLQLRMQEEVEKEEYLNCAVLRDIINYQ